MLTSLTSQAQPANPSTWGFEELNPSLFECMSQCGHRVVSIYTASDEDWVRFTTKCNSSDRKCEAQGNIKIQFNEANKNVTISSGKFNHVNQCVTAAKFDSAKILDTVNELMGAKNNKHLNVNVERGDYSLKLKYKNFIFDGGDGFKAFCKSGISTAQTYANSTLEKEKQRQNDLCEKARTTGCDVASSPGAVMYWDGQVEAIGKFKEFIDCSFFK